MVTTEDGTRSDGAGGGSGSAVAAGRLRRLSGGLVTIVTVGALVTAMGLTLLGLGVADTAIAGHDASAWLWSAPKSEIARVNGLTGRVDTRVAVPRAANHQMQVVQTDRLVVLRDVKTGQVSSLDLATLQIMATLPTSPGMGVSVALHDDAVFVIDAVQGIVQQLDPRALVPVGEPIHYPPGITGGFFDGTGRLWVAVPSEGTVSAIAPAVLPSTTASPTGTTQRDPVQIHTVAVTEPSHDLTISALDEGVVVLDRTTGVLTIVSDGDRRTVPLTLAGAGVLPERSHGDRLVVTVPEHRRVYVVGDRGVDEFTVPGTGSGLGPALAWAGRFYCADDDIGVVYTFDDRGRLVDTIEVQGANGPLELEVREQHLFINAPNSSTARVIDDEHQARVVDKYANDILGGDPPPSPPPKPKERPTVGKPGAPKRVTAAAGDARVRISWRPAPANGSAITKYVVEGAGRRHEVGANQRSLEITGLANGKTYRFSVYAVNAKGAGPKRTSNPVMPTAEVPDPPSRVTAEARPDGSVLVKWPAADGQGNKIARYIVTATSAGANAPIGESTKTQLIVGAGELTYGTQYAFSVVAVNERGAGSKSSPLSNTVVPFTRPGAPEDLTARTVADRAGTIEVTWSAAEDNGRPVTKYVVEAAGRSTEVTGTRTTLTGLGNGQTITVTVRAVNEAGAGPAASDTARTVAAPRITVTGTSATYTSVTITFTVDAGGGTATCAVAVNGGPPRNSNCNSFTVSNLQTDTSYRLVVSAQNVAGATQSPERAQATRKLYGTVVCSVPSYCGDGIGVYSRPWQDTSSFTSPDAFGGERYQTFCWAQGAKGNQQPSATINAEPYGGRRSDKWIKISRSSERYIPYAWINLDGGVSYTTLPQC